MKLSLSLALEDKVLERAVVKVLEAVYEAESVVFAGKGKHRHVAGFQLDFSEALDAKCAGAAANYILSRTVHEKGRSLALSVPFRVVQNAAAETRRIAVATSDHFCRRRGSSW